MSNKRPREIDAEDLVSEGAPAIGLRERLTQVTQFFRTARTKGHQLMDEDERRGRPAAEQVGEREERRLGGMSAEVREWEQASLQRDRERQVRLSASKAPADE